MITEEFLHYVWQQKAYDVRHIKLADGSKLDIINPGTPNYDAGPDFFNAKIKIGDTIWAGNVEIHIKSSMWFEHKHQNNIAYDNIILHVVAEYDKPVFRKNGEEIPVFIMKIPVYLKNNYTNLQSSLTWIPCEPSLKKMDAITRSDLLDRMAYERLQSKTNDVSIFYNDTNGSWEETWYRTFIIAWGLKTNKIPFMLLSKQTPYSILRRHAHNLFQLEALLLGQAGLLQIADSDEYVEKLLKEYNHLQKKYSLQPIEAHLWKFARMRPSNFPSIRLMQLAALINKHPSMVSELTQSSNIGNIRDFFEVQVSTYWLNHYRPGIISVKRSKNIGRNMLDLIVINAVAPFMFFYGSEHQNYNMKEFAHSVISELLPENNRIIRKWKDIGLESTNAFETQALLQLYSKYCTKKRCVQCSWGHRLIQKSKEKCL